jgi:hypothetical protein
MQLKLSHWKSLKSWSCEFVLQACVNHPAEALSQQIVTQLTLRPQLAQQLRRRLHAPALAQVLEQDRAPALFNLVFGEGIVNDATTVAVLRTVQARPPQPRLCHPLTAQPAYHPRRFLRRKVRTVSASPPVLLRRAPRPRSAWGRCRS